MARRQLYLNYGALSLATIVQMAGYETVLVHGEHREPGEVLDDLRLVGRFPSRYPLMLSIPSFYALPWAQEFCQLVKAVDPCCRVVVGGRWVVGPDISWLRTLLPEADEFAPGLSESYIKDLLTGSIAMQRIAEPTPNFILNHTLVEGYQKYQPSIEASRGCGMGCLFCEERDIPIEKLGHPSTVARSLVAVQHQYNGGEINPYLQSSMFLPTPRWAAGLAEEVHRLDLRINWRTETRVDSMLPETVAALAEAGLKVLDLGLETASPTQILAMDKASRPEVYLRKAEDLLDSCRKYGVMAKINVLLYAGETSVTLRETEAWLDSKSNCIAGVSVGPVVAYGPPKTANALIQDLVLRGARPVVPNSAAFTGITKVHLSDEFDALAAEEASLKLSRRYMDSDAYFSLKKFSYYPRGYDRHAFNTDVQASDPAVLPFRMD